MNRSVLTQKILDLFKDVVETQEAGQKEYAFEDNAFSNFEKLADELQIDRKKILWILAMKHKDGIGSFLNGHTSQRESVIGRIKDLIVYLFILWVMIDEESQPLGRSLAAHHYRRMQSMLNSAYPGHSTGNR